MVDIDCDPVFPPGTGNVVWPPVEFPDPKCGDVPEPVPFVGVLPPHLPWTAGCPFEHTH